MFLMTPQFVLRQQSYLIQYPWICFVDSANSVFAHRVARKFEQDTFVAPAT